VVEGGGAAGLAALLPGGPLDCAEYKNKNIVVLLCGGNIDITMLVRSCQEVENSIFLRVAQTLRGSLAMCTAGSGLLAETIPQDCTLLKY
jgi:hypothetical protein